MNHTIAFIVWTISANQFPSPETTDPRYILFTSLEKALNLSKLFISVTQADKAQPRDVCILVGSGNIEGWVMGSISVFLAGAMVGPDGLSGEETQAFGKATLGGDR